MANQELETRLGHKFSNAALLSQALTHRSFGIPNNERLEFLGDSILNCAIAKLLYDRFPDLPEGELSRLRANLVNQSVLAEIASTLVIGSHLRLGEGEIKTGGAARASILADAVEALLGAVYLDSGFASAEKIVQRLFEERLMACRDGPAEKDSKTALQEWLQARKLKLPRYSVARIAGEAHQQTFIVNCEIDTPTLMTTGSGASRRGAEQDAARKAFELILAGKVGTPK